MGYFNYFIKVTIRRFVNCLINRKTVKIFMFIFILSLILIKIFNNSVVYGATIIQDTTYYDGYSANIDDMQMLQNDFIIRLEGLGEEHSAKIDFMQKIKTGGYALFIYYGDGQGGDYLNSRPILKKNVISVFLMPINSLVTLENGISQNWGRNGEISCNRYTASATYYEYKFTGANFVLNSLPARTAGHWYPSYLFNYKSDFLSEYIVSYFQGNTSKVIEAIENSTNDIVNSQTQIKNEIEQTKEFLEDSTVNDEVIVLPEDETEDSSGTSAYISDLFNLLLNAFKREQYGDFVLTFPHTNQQYILNYNTVYGNFFEKDIYTRRLKELIQLGYWYLIGMYVIKDISNKVNKIKVGDIDKIQTGNIKEDLL